MRSLIRWLVFTTALLAMTASAWAGSFDPAASLRAIDADAAVGRLTVDQTALYAAYALAAPQRLPAAYHRTTDAGAPRSFCGTPAMIVLNNLLPQASPAVQAEVRQLLLPGKSRGQTPRDGKALTDNPDGVDLPNVHYQGRFAIRWGNDYDPAPGAVEYWANVLENEVWATEIDAWDYPDVYLTDLYYIDMYIGNSGDGAPQIGFSGAYTTVYYNTYQPYIVFFPDILNYDESVQEVSAHEFFHTIEFSEGLTDHNYFIFGNGSTWFVEGSATWAESVVYPDYNGYTYYIHDWASRPSDALTGDSNLAPYARVLWAMYLYDHYQGLDTLHDLWTSNRGSNALFGNAGYLSGVEGVDWTTAFVDFARAVVLHDFVDGQYVPDFDPYATVTAYPYTQTDIYSASDEPHINSLHLVLARPGDETDPRLNVRFVGSDITMTETEWALAAIKTVAGGDAEVEILAPTDGKSDYTIDGLGTTYDNIYLLITPLSSSEDNNSAHWDYQLQLTRGDEDFPPMDDDDDTSADDDDDTSTGDDDDDDDNDDDNGGQGDDDDDDNDSGGCGG